MNLFEQYGIKEVADVTFYNITRIGDEEFYTPVLHLDTLKVSTLEKSAENVSAQGGKGNKKLITWNFGKEIKLSLEDALFSPASMSMIWGGKLEAKLSPYTSAIVKINLANKYGKLHYSTKAYNSPPLTEEEWEIVYRAATEAAVRTNIDDRFAVYWKELYNKDVPDIERNRTELRKRYINRNWYTSHLADLKAASPEILMPTEYSYSENEDAYDEWLNSQSAMPDAVVKQILSFIDELNKINTIETQIYDTECIDRSEKCTVENEEGLIISTSEQKKNLLRYYQNDKTSSYIIYYDVQTMRPLLNLTDTEMIQGWDSYYPYDSDYDKNMDGLADEDEFIIRKGTQYYKWSRTVKASEDSDGILGKTFVIDSDTFPGTYKIEGETTIRSQKTQQDITYKFTIFRANVSSDTSIKLEAEGDPTVFSMDIDVLSPPNGIQMELKQFETETDHLHGGTRIVPQRNYYSHTQTDKVEKVQLDFTNKEYY